MSHANTPTATTAPIPMSTDRHLQPHMLVRRSIALVLAGGRGSRLKQLTDKRAKPAVYFGGKFRIIDFALSNCVNSGIRRIGVITQYKSHSLLRHLQRGWSFLRAELNEMVDLLPAQQRVDEEHWYRGTADAIYQNLDIIQSSNPEFVVVLAGDHVYKMDYSLMLVDHVNTGAGCTVGCIEVPRDEASAFGVMAIDETRQVIDFVEKPADPPAMPGNDAVSLASMGIYVFNADYLNQLLIDDIANPESSHDFGKDIIPRVVREGRAVAHPFSMSCVSSTPDATPYWRDVGTIDAFWEARTRHLRHAMADLDQPAPIATRQIRARHGRQTRPVHQHHGVGRLHRLGLHREQFGVLFQRARALVLPDRPGRFAAGSHRRPQLPPEQGGDRPGLQTARRPGDRRRSRARRRTLRAQSARRGAGHQRHVEPPARLNRFT
jgi:glucose-1-phosphate adenylyltransferase